MSTATIEENRTHSSTRILYNNLLSGAGTSGAEVVLNPNTWQRWESASGTMQSTFSLSSATVDCVAIGAHNLSSAGASVKVETTTTAGSGYVERYNAIPPSNGAIMVTFDPVDSCVEIRITVTGGSDREIGVIYAGECLKMERGIFGGHTPLSFAQATEYRNNTSDTGNFLGRRVRRSGLKNMFMWSNMDDAFTRSEFLPFKQAAVLDPFFIQWRPDFYPDECAYGYAESDISVSNVSGVSRMMQAQLNFIGYA